MNVLASAACNLINESRAVTDMTIVIKEQQVTIRDSIT